MTLLTGGRAPPKAGAPRLTAEAAESQRERHGAAHRRPELHRVQRGRETSQPRLRRPPKREPRLVALDQDRRQSRPGAKRAELGDEEQALGFGGQRPEAVAQLLAHGLNLA